MSTFNTVDIPLDLILLKSDTIPTAMSKMISNQGLLEKYVEDLYNKLEIEFGSSSAIIGKSTPVDLINSNKVNIASLNDGGNIIAGSGLYISKTVDDFTNSGFFKAVDINGSFGTELLSDIVRVNQKLVLESGAYIDKVNADGETLPHQFITLDVEGTDVTNNVLTLSEDSKNIIIVDLIINVDLYDTDWIDNGDVSITIKMDSVKPVRDGQYFDIVVRNIYKADGTTPITTNYSYGIIHFVGDSSFNIKPYTDSENKLISNTSGAFVSFDIINRYVKLTDTGGTGANFLLKK